MEEAEFDVIAKPIDDEVYCVIPINNLGPAYIPVLSIGMGNPNEAVSEQCAESLIRIMRLEDTNAYDRIKIFELIKTSQYSSKILKGFSIEELDKLDDKKALNIFMEKNGKQENCFVVDDDRYDSKKGIYYTAPTFKYKPILNKREYKWPYQIRKKSTDEKKKKEKIRL